MNSKLQKSLPEGFYFKTSEGWIGPFLDKDELVDTAKVIGDLEVTEIVNLIVWTKERFNSSTGEFVS